MLVISLFALLPLLQPVTAAPLSILKSIGFGALTAASKTAVTTLLGPSFESEFLRPAQFARLVYCSSPAVQALNCGGPCDALGGGVQVLKTGGDGKITPRFFVASDTSTQTIVVSHQGTNSSSELSIANDTDLELVPIDKGAFPQAPAGVRVHNGFQIAFLRTATEVRDTVQSALDSTGFKKVLVTGHSLGAAISTMDTLMLRMALAKEIDVTGKVFGLPRGGDQAFADLIDNLLGSNFKFVTNQQDPVPIVPLRFMQFQHSSGELHITGTDAKGDPTVVIQCTGQENELCINGNKLSDASFTNHRGPYLKNITMGKGCCPA